MPQRISQKVVNTFVKGLITEAGELTFPENASVDELNCLLQRDGSRRRRLSAVTEDNFVDSSFTVTDTFVFHTSMWRNVAGQAGLDFLVVQNGPTLHFYDTAQEPYSAGEKSFTVDLTAFEHAGSGGAGTAYIDTTSINGDLVVVSPAIEPFYITYAPSNNTIQTAQINIRARDFEWLGDTAAYLTPSTPFLPVSVNRLYDSANAGWVGVKGDAALNTYLSATNSYPALTLPWYAGKDSNGDFSVAEWDKIFAGSSLTGNGHFILNFFAPLNRLTASGIAGVISSPEPTRFQTVVAFSGRVFYAGLTSAKNGGKIFFSRQLDNITEVGQCFQQNDPTSEDFSDLLDTDGGVIVLPEAMNIQKLYVLGSSLFIFAENGVWRISGVDNVFRATEYAVQKVTSTGIQNARTFVDVEGIPLWWSKHGIHTVTVDSVSGNAADENLSIPTIQEFFDKIDGNAKVQCKGTYDSINKRVLWFYPNNAEAVDNKKNRVLTLDIALQAFYPWEVADESGSTSYIVGAEYYSGFGSDILDINVVTGAGDNVVTASGDDVIIQSLSQIAQANSATILMVRNGATGKMTMGLFKGTDFLDWHTADYHSYAEAGYDFMGDLVLKKTSPYIQVYMRPTEEGWTGSQITGYDPIRESSLLVSAFWDFRRGSSSVPQQAYRLKYVPVVDTGNLGVWDYPEEVVATRLKLRGYGRSMRLRFESETGKDFVLLGYGVIQGVNQRF
jgi:hypothetical protein